ncbi:unnamed protein product [Moneuplotes crassus]|uniref:Uncharacterized protein n=1 Tax=Euplotes crassus TaxID=5936 RepID=A0AAD1UGV7_EUPCR|nr:unnamed protein product [Moneuplotes crassus]
MESEDQVVQGKYGEKISLEKCVLVESNKQGYQRCCCIYYNLLSCEIKAKLPDPESDGSCVGHCIGIKFEDPQYTKFIKKIKFLKFFSVNKFRLNFGDMRNKHIVNLIDYSFPNKTNEIYASSSTENKMNRVIYFNSLIRISSKVTREVTFNCFCFSFPQLKRFVAAYIHVKNLNLWYCKLSIPTVIDFSKALQNCQIQVINLLGTGSYSCNNWRDNFDEFNNMIQSFSTSSDLRKSLRRVYIRNCLISQNEAEEIFAENKLGGVEIIGGS